MAQDLIQAVKADRDRKGIYLTSLTACELLLLLFCWLISSWELLENGDRGTASLREGVCTTGLPSPAGCFTSCLPICAAADLALCYM